MISFGTALDPKPGGEIVRTVRERPKSPVEVLSTLIGEVAPAGKVCCLVAAPQ